MLNKSGESEHPFPVLGLREKALSFSPLSMILTVDFVCSLYPLFNEFLS